MSATHESCMNAQEVADLLRITKRAFLERRHGRMKTMASWFGIATTAATVAPIFSRCQLTQR